MGPTNDQPELFGKADVLGDARDKIITVNHRCRAHTRDGYRVISACGVILAHYSVGDRMAEAHARVAMVEQGWAKQTEVARAFGCDVRTVRRDQRRFENGGLAALGQPSGYPKGRARISKGRMDKVNTWKSKGVSNREIGRRLGVNEKAVRKLLRRLGWPSGRCQEQLSMELGAVDSNLSSSKSRQTTDASQFAEITTGICADGADLNLSGVTSSACEGLSLDVDPMDRSIDRILARLGLLDDAAPRFSSSTQVMAAGVLLAVPALIDSGVLDIAREIYGSIGPAFYGLRTTVMTLLMMALLRIKRPEGLKERSPQQFGRLFGLDRAPEVKTLRRKLTRLAAYRRAADFGRALAEHRVTFRGHAMGFLYVDGHVRVYHGKHEIPKTHVTRMRISLPATTDYWINDTEGEPLFVISTEANRGLVQMLPIILAEVRKVVGERRVTVVFDRGGWSPKLFAHLINEGFDILTYRKGPWPRVPISRFCQHKAIVDGREVDYCLADQGVYLSHGQGKNRRRLHLRQVTRLNDNGHQTPIITSRRDLSTIEIAQRMFDRWRQENFFKYLREEFALDALVDYGVEAADATREVPNPVRKQIDAKLRQARVALEQLQSEYGLEALVNEEQIRRTMRGFKIANAELSNRVFTVLKQIVDLEKKRAQVPARVPVNEVVEGDVLKLTVERKHLTDILKMVAYQAEGDLVRLLRPHYRRTEDEGRTLVQTILAASGDIEVNADNLHIAIDPLSAPHKTQALVAICDELNGTAPIFPGTKLRLRFSVKPEPPKSSAFPGSRSNHDLLHPQPDISYRG